MKIRVKISVSLTHLMLISLCNHETITELYFISMVGVCASCTAVYTLGSKTSMNPLQYDYVIITFITMEEKYILNTNIFKMCTQNLNPFWETIKPRYQV